MEALKKRTYLNWRSSQIRHLEQHYQFYSDQALAKLYGTTPDAIEIRRRRLKLKRPKAYLYFSPGQLAIEFKPKPTPAKKSKPERKPSRTALFIKEEEKYQAPTLNLIEEVKPLIEKGCYEEVKQKLDKLPFEHYDYMLEKCDPPKKSLRDCLSATLRWFFRQIEVDPGHSTNQDLKLLTRTMNKVCNFC